MASEEIEILINDVDQRLERLKAAYEQYFLGIEKIPPMKQHQDLDRMFRRLRKEQVRNTALRFRMNMITQRYNTYQQHWNRIMREIEAGTYRRHMLKASKRFGDDAEHLAKKGTLDEQAKREREEKARRMLEQVPDLDSFDIEVEFDMDEESSIEAPAHFDQVPDLATTQRTSPAHAQTSRTSKSRLEQLDEVFEEDEDDITQPNAIPAFLRESFHDPTPGSTEPAGHPSPPPVAAPSRPLGIKRPEAPKIARPARPTHAAGVRQPGSKPGVGSARLRAPSREQAAPQAAKPAQQAPSIPKAPRARVPVPKPPTRPGQPGLRRPPAHQAHTAAPRPVRDEQKAHPRAPQPPTAQGKPRAELGKSRGGSPSHAGASASHRQSSTQATSRRGEVRSPARLASSAERNTERKSRQTARSESREANERQRRVPQPRKEQGGLPPERVREIYKEYVTARRSCHESTSNITERSLAASLSKSAEKLRKKHGRDVDFEVVIHKGKAVIKPKLKKK